MIPFHHREILSLHEELNSAMLFTKQLLYRLTIEAFSRVAQTRTESPRFGDEWFAVNRQPYLLACLATIQDSLTQNQFSYLLEDSVILFDPTGGIEPPSNTFKECAPIPIQSASEYSDFNGICTHVSELRLQNPRY